MNNDLAVIMPGFMLKHFIERESHLLLPHLIDNDDTYREYYFSRKFPLTILDNGAFEKQATDMDDLLAYARAAKATHIVVPDDITCETHDPLSKFLDVAISLWPKYRAVYVVHGKSVEEYAQRGLEALSYQASMNEEDRSNMLIAFPSICLRTHADGKPEELRPRAMAKIRCGWMAKCFAHNKSYKVAHIHLFGAVSLKEAQACLTQGLIFATRVTLDTCDPVRLGTEWSTKRPYQTYPNLDLTLSRVAHHISLYEKMWIPRTRCTTEKVECSPSTLSTSKGSTSTSATRSSTSRGVTTKGAKKKTCAKR